MGKRYEPRDNIKYSLAFKQKVVSEIESGKLNKNQAMQLYGIKGGSTIHYWIKRMGKNHLINKTVRVELKGEPQKLTELKKRNRELEKALADAHLRLIAYESYMEETGVEFFGGSKKKPVLELLREQKPGQKKQEKKHQ